MTDNTQEDVREAVEIGLGTYDVEVVGDIETTEIDEGQYNVRVQFSGELLFNDVLENHGQLLYNKEAEIMWDGVKDGKLVLTVTMTD